MAMVDAEPMNRQIVHGELERARRTFHDLLASADEDDLSRPTLGTRWTNEQLLFHMLFGYMVVRSLLVLARVFGRLPSGVSRAYARLLNAATRPFDVINYLGPCVAVYLYGHRRMGAKADRVIASLHKQLEGESEANLALGMHYPVR
ncbi:DinB family protein [Kitasatospora sp. NPDC058965]|uniref:DinB family protein n=1 Tax=Kitasatospora sp. NPDC058965 TaxID=3346682 RepID=UPI00367E8C35